ncbi:SLAP domain-containing protein [Ornithinibacillus sp. 179-J 7C1 HS]|uniref:SLAP domain-containing protein n=1 Tax=Ornithinibacillus sp. 179-J 7C1 HS TaxID=3142384 RepID=UPI0039A00B35
MQKLQYESAWDKTISPKDRTLVEETFKHSTLNGEPIQFTPLRFDWNYKNELLVLVIVHNTTNEDFTFNQTKLSLKDHEVTLAEHIFSTPNLNVEAKTSMPWTFIFPVGSYVKDQEVKKGILEITK